MIKTETTRPTERQFGVPFNPWTLGELEQDFANITGVAYSDTNLLDSFSHKSISLGAGFSAEIVLSHGYTTSYTDSFWEEIYVPFPEETRFELEYATGKRPSIKTVPVEFHTTVYDAKNDIVTARFGLSLEGMEQLEGLTIDPELIQTTHVNVNNKPRTLILPGAPLKLSTAQLTINR